MKLDIPLGKEGNVLFNDALNTFYLRLYGVRHMVKDYSDSKRENPLPPHGLLLGLHNEQINECLMTPQHKNKSAIGCQTNCNYIKS